MVIAATFCVQSSRSDAHQNYIELMYMQFKICQKNNKKNFRSWPKYTEIGKVSKSRRSRNFRRTVDAGCGTNDAELIFNSSKTHNFTKDWKNRKKTLNHLFSAGASISICCGMSKYIEMRNSCLFFLAVVGFFFSTRTQAAVISLRKLNFGCKSSNAHLIVLSNQNDINMFVPTIPHSNHNSPIPVALCLCIIR